MYFATYHHLTYAGTDAASRQYTRGPIAAKFSLIEFSDFEFKSLRVDYSISREPNYFQGGFANVLIFVHMIVYFIKISYVYYTHSTITQVLLATQLS